jgi:hypothetical protein
MVLAGDEDALDGGAVGKAEEDLLGRVRSGLRLDDFRGVDCGQFRQALPEVPARVVISSKDRAPCW